MSQSETTSAPRKRRRTTTKPKPKRCSICKTAKSDDGKYACPGYCPRCSICDKDRQLHVRLKCHCNKNYGRNVCYTCVMGKQLFTSVDFDDSYSDELSLNLSCIDCKCCGWSGASRLSAYTFTEGAAGDEAAAARNLCETYKCPHKADGCKQPELSYVAMMQHLSNPNQCHRVIRCPICQQNIGKQGMEFRAILKDHIRSACCKIPCPVCKNTSTLVGVRRCLFSHTIPAQINQFRRFSDKICSVMTQNNIDAKSEQFESFYLLFREQQKVIRAWERAGFISADTSAFNNLEQNLSRVGMGGDKAFESKSDPTTASELMSDVDVDTNSGSQNMTGTDNANFSSTSITSSIEASTSASTTANITSTSCQVNMALVPEPLPPSDSHPSLSAPSFSAVPGMPTVGSLPSVLMRLDNESDDDMNIR